MWQVGQIFRQAGIAEYFSKLPVIAAADLKPTHEKFAGTALRMHPLGGALQYAVKLPSPAFQFSDYLPVVSRQGRVVAQFAFQNGQLSFPEIAPLLDHFLLFAGQTFFILNL